MPLCAICQHLAVPPSDAAGTVGLLTSAPTLVREAIDNLGMSSENEQHIVVYACPEHVVDVYRGRVAGVRMAWRLDAEPASTRLPQSPAATSASPA
jgi:hypothetical protein